jgi:hypothetical protein
MPYHKPNGLKLRKELLAKEAKAAADAKAPKGRPLSKRENNAKQYRFNVRLVRRALKLDAEYKEMSDARKREEVAKLNSRYQMLKNARDKFMKVYPKMNWQMKELNRKHNRFVDGKCFQIGFLQGKLTPTHEKMYMELENTPYKQGLSFRVSEKDTDDEDAIYLEVMKAIRAAALGGGQAAGGKAAAEEASGDEEAAEDDTAIYVSSSPAPVRMRQKRKANVPDGGYTGSKPKSKPRKWTSRMKDLK